MKKAYVFMLVVCLILCITGCRDEEKKVIFDTKVPEQAAESVVAVSTQAEEQKYIIEITETSETSISDAVDYANGECGKHLQWALSVDGVLTISDYGAMYDLPYKDSAPWYDYREKIQKIIVKEGVTSIDSWAFFNCENLQSVKLSESITELGMSAFQGCTSLEVIELPDLIEKIPKQLFTRCTALKVVELPDNLETIGDFAFSECTSLSGITLPAKTWAIGNYAFQECTGLESIDIPDSVSSIGNEAFTCCSSLKTVTIPEKISHLSNTFFKCVGLKEVYFEGDAPGISTGAFTGVNATCYYPAGNRTWTIAKMDNYGGNLSWEMR